MGPALPHVMKVTHSLFAWPIGQNPTALFHKSSHQYVAKLRVALKQEPDNNARQRIGSVLLGSDLLLCLSDEALGKVVEDPGIDLACGRGSFCCAQHGSDGARLHDLTGKFMSSIMGQIVQDSKYSIKENSQCGRSLVWSSSTDQPWA